MGVSLKEVSSISVMCFITFFLFLMFRATLCVAELEDSFRFRKLCLQAQLEECDVLSESLEHRMDLTSERHSMYLNLVATVFLPLTFFAGVFGMNFQVDGGYVLYAVQRFEIINCYT